MTFLSCIYTILLQVAVMVPIHTFNAPMLPGNPVEHFYGILHAYDIKSFLRCTTVIRFPTCNYMDFLPLSVFHSTSYGQRRVHSHHILGMFSTRFSHIPRRVPLCKHQQGWLFLYHLRDHNARIFGLL